MQFDWVTPVNTWVLGSRFEFRFCKGNGVLGAAQGGVTCVWMGRIRLSRTGLMYVMQCQMREFTMWWVRYCCGPA